MGVQVSWTGQAFDPAQVRRCLGMDYCPHIVVVEDEDAQRKLLVDYLSQRKFRVTGVDGGIALRRAVFNLEQLAANIRILRMTSTANWRSTQTSSNRLPPNGISVFGMSAALGTHRCALQQNLSANVSDGSNRARSGRPYPPNDVCFAPRKRPRLRSGAICREEPKAVVFYCAPAQPYLLQACVSMVAHQRDEVEQVPRRGRAAIEKSFSKVTSAPNARCFLVGANERVSEM
jgi:CheY-like chemotaxis protein